MSQFSHLFPPQRNEPVVQSTSQRTGPNNTEANQAYEARYQQAVPGQSSVPSQAIASSSPANAASPFDVDAWLADLDVGPQTTQTPKSMPNGLHADQHAMQNGLSSTHSSSDNSSTKPRYMPPHLRSPPNERAGDINMQQPVTKTPPPGFGVGY